MRGTLRISGHSAREICPGFHDAQLDIPQPGLAPAAAPAATATSKTAHTIFFITLPDRD
jgi:hypothetical protein